MFKGLRERALAAELMDDFSCGGEELRQALRELRVLNRLFAASGPTLHGVEKLWLAAGKPKRLSILDVGSGSGDVNIKLMRWAEQKKVDLSVTLVDMAEEACAEAKRLFRDEPRIEVKQADLRSLAGGCADIVTGTQFAHHFAQHELPEAVATMMKAARYGVVINDIHRHWIPWLAVWMTTRLISSNRYILNDAPLSVAKGFIGRDWDRLRNDLVLNGTNRLSYSWRPLFRYSVVIKQSGGG